MRTNVVIDDELMSRTLKTCGYRTKKAAIEAGLRVLLQVHSQQKLRNLKGKIHWDGDLAQMRED